MDYITIGRLTIQGRWLVLAFAVLISYGILRYLTKYKIQKSILDDLFNSLFLGVIVLKLSLLLIHPKLVVDNPLSLIYFSGGPIGFWLAVTIASLYYFYRTWKNGEPNRIIFNIYLFFLFCSYTMYHLLALSIMHDLKHALSLLVSLLIFMWYFIKRKSIKSMKNIGFGVLFIVLIVWVVYDHQSKQQGILTSNQEGIIEGDQAINFTLQTLDGNHVSLNDYKGKTIILNFWATWCPPCKAEMPHMEEYYQDNNQKNIIILGVNLTSTETNESKVKKFKNDYGLTFPILMDTADEVGKLYHAVTIPTTYFIDETGVIREKIVGPMSKDTMKNIINKMMEKEK